MSDIRIDFDRLSRAHDRLTTVVNDFEGAGELGAQLPGAVGYPPLMSVTDQFRSAWSVRRGELADELRFLDDAVVAIRDTFQELDLELVRRLEAATRTEGQ